MKNTKKGFTLVEIVIVIAVIAILAAVLIPTFAGVIERTRESTSLQQAISSRDEYLSEKHTMLKDIDGYVIVVDENCYVIDKDGTFSETYKGTLTDFEQEKGVRYQEIGTTSNASIYKPINLADIEPEIEEDTFDYTVPGVYFMGETYSWSEAVADGLVTVDGTTFKKVDKNVKKIVFPETIQTLASNSFESSKATDVVLPESLKTIKSFCFRYAQKIVKIHIPDGVTTIENDAFYGCYLLTEVNFPASLTTLGSGFFKQNYAIKSVTLPSTLTSVPSGMFNSCSNLETVVLPDTIKTIESGAFNGCNKLKNINIPYGVTTIASQAFYNCFSLEEITIPASVTSIASNAFGNCYKLVHIKNLSSSVSFASQTSFGMPNNVGREVVTTVDGEFVNTIETVNNKYSIFTVGTDKYLLGLKNFNFTSANDIPENVNKIYKYALYGHLNLLSVTIPESVVEIGNNAFLGCNKMFQIRNLSNVKVAVNTFGITNKIRNLEILTDDTPFTGTISYGKKYITAYYPDGEKYLLGFADVNETDASDIPADITVIYSYAFMYNTLLSNVKFPNGVREVLNEAFHYCASIKTLVLPVSLTHFADSAFAYMFTLSKVYYKGSMSDWCNIKMDSLYASPMAAAGELYVMDSLGNFAEPIDVVIDEGVTKINPYVFMFLKIESIVLPSTLKTIETGAFERCTELRSVTIPASVTKIGDSAFYNCTSLEVIFEEDSQLEIIGGQAFSKVPLTSIVLPSTMMQVGGYAFEDCTQLTTVIFEEGSGVSTIESETFRGCSSLETIVLPDNLYSIREYAFEGCSSLTTITIPASCNEIYWAFSRGPVLTEAIFEEPTGWSYSGYETVDKMISVEEYEELENDPDANIMWADPIYDYVDDEEVVTGYYCFYEKYGEHEIDFSDSSEAAQFLLENEQYCITRY